MENVRNLLISKGGGYRNIPRQLVEERVEKFVKKTRNTTPKELREPWKGLVLFTVVEYFGWDYEEGAEYLNITPRTAKTRYDEAKYMFSFASMWTRRTYNGGKFVLNLRDYIYYNIYRR